MAIDPDVWAAMCPPVRARYQVGGAGRLRRMTVSGLAWLARRQARPAASELPINGRILVVQPDHLGGVLASTPALRLIKETLPTCELTVLAGPWGADVAEHCPIVDRVRTCRVPAFDRALRVPGRLGPVRARLTPLSRLFDAAAELRTERYAAALVLADDYWCAALTALAGIPIRAGIESPYAAPFLTHALSVVAPPVGRVPAPAPPEHVSETHLRLARLLLGLSGRPAAENASQAMSYEPTPADRAEAVRAWRANDLDEASSIAVIHPTPGGAAKRWSAERFAIVSDHLTGRLGATVVFTGGPGDVAEVRGITRRCVRRPVDLAGQTSFGGLAALLDRARLAIGPDNGAMHLAAARSVPTVRLFGPTDARVWGIWPHQQERPKPFGCALSSPRRCSPCHRLDVPDWRTVPGASGDVYPCLEDLPVESVIAEIERVWLETDAR